MDRRSFLAQLPASAAGLSVALASTAEAQAAANNSRLNILFLIADDLTFRAMEAGTDRQVKTPNLDRLAAQGCRFTHCFHQGAWDGAICVPSRTMLNTGLTTFKAARAIPANESANVPTWGQTFRAAGYETFITGKWHLDAVSLNRSFEHQVCVGPGFLPSTKEMYSRPAPGNDWNPADQSLAGHWLHQGLWKNEPGDSIEHSSSVYAESAIAFLEGRRKQHERPFFMYIGFNAPHDPRQAPQTYLDMYPADKMRLPPNYLPQHPFEIGMDRGRDEVLAPFPRTEEAIRVHRREYYAILTHMDAEVGRILAALDASGEAGNTYVVFTADHGIAIGEHGLMGKQNQYECSMRMPLVLRGPGITPGTVRDELVYQHSVFATTCDLAGIPKPAHVEFPSLKPLLTAPSTTPRSTTPLYESVFGWLTNLQRSVRTTQYRMIYYPPSGRYQLFDIQQDPWELLDLSASPEHAGALRHLQQLLAKHQRELGDPLAAEAAHA